MPSLDPLAQAPALAAAVLEARRSAACSSAASRPIGTARRSGPRWPRRWGGRCSTGRPELEIDGDDVVAVHDVDDGSAAWRAPLPVVATTQQGLNEPRYPTLPNIMKAKRKPLERRALEGAAPTVATVRVEVPSRARRGVILDGDVAVAARELARRLRDEAKVL